MDSGFILDLGRLKLMIGDGYLFQLRADGIQEPLMVGAPRLEVNGTERGDFYFDGIIETENLPNSGKETVLLYTTQSIPNLEMRLFIRSFPGSCILSSLICSTH